MQALVFISVVLAIISFFIATASFLRSKSIRKDLKIFFSGKKAEDLEKVIMGHAKEIVSLDKEIQELFEISNKIHKLASKGIHKVGVVRFNPFKDIGGDQSFALALLDGKDNGLIISSLHTREGTRVYSKPITKGEADNYPLTGEEEKAVKIAKNSKISKKL